MSEVEKGITDGPEPNAYVLSTDLFPAVLDTLMQVERTAFQNGTCLIVDSLDADEDKAVRDGRIVPMYTLSADKEDKSVVVGLSLHLPLGQCTLLVFVGHVLALTLDREDWLFGEVPSHDALLAALGDALHVLRENDDNDLADWLHVRAVKMLKEWEEEIVAEQARLQPKSTVEA